MNPILDDLLQSLTSSVWRSREASCLALNNLLQTGVTHSSDAESRTRLLVSKLPELWKTLIRVADDIKETVRKAALDTCKRLQKVCRIVQEVIYSIDLSITLPQRYYGSATLPLQRNSCFLRTGKFQNCCNFQPLHHLFYAQTVFWCIFLMIYSLKTAM